MCDRASELIPTDLCAVCLPLTSHTAHNVSQLAGRQREWGGG